MRRTLLIGLLFSLHHNLLAQEVDRIDTDRPDQTESAVTLPKKFFQMEFGFGKENVGEKNFSLSHPDFLFKYGLAKRIELRLEGSFFSAYSHVIPNPITRTLFAPVEIGTKVALFEEKGLRPKTTFLGHIGLPFTGSERDQNQQVFPSIRFLFQHTLSEHVGLGYNAGAAWDGFTDHPVWIYTFSPNFNIGKNWYAYVETFGFYRKGDAAQNNLDTGLAYYVTESIKVDLSGGIGLGSSPLRNYIAIGGSIRFGPKAK